MPKQCNTMQDVRTEIDRVDRELVRLLLERLDYIRQAGLIKTDRNTVRDPDRVEDVVAKVRAEAGSDDTHHRYIEDIYRPLIEWSIQYEFTVWDKHNSED